MWMSARENKHKRCKIPSLACQPVEAHEHIIQQKQKCLNRCYPSPPAPRNEYVSSIMSHQQRWPKKEELQVGSTTLTYQQATQRHVMHKSAQHGAMLLSLPYQGIVLHLLPFLPSPHRCIKRCTSVWRGYDLFFLANLVIHSTDKLLLPRKYQGWARPATLPYQVMCNMPSLPS